MKKPSDTAPTQGKVETPVTKRKYEPPRLSRLGAIASLTAGGGQAKAVDTSKNSN